MKVGDNIKILLSCGIVEEGIIKDLDFKNGIDSYMVLLHSISGKELNVNKKYIAAYQINIVEKIETLVIEDLSLDKPVENVKLRINKLAKLAINRGASQRSIVKKMIENPNSKNNLTKYNLPSFLKND